MVVSDDVLKSLIDMAGKVLVAVIPTVAVIMSGRKTRRHVKRESDDVKKAIRTERDGITTLTPSTDRDVSERLRESERRRESRE